MTKKTTIVDPKDHVDITEEELQKLYDERAGTERIVMGLSDDLLIAHKHLYTIEKSINEILTKKLKIWRVECNVTSSNNNTFSTN